MVGWQGFLNHLGPSLWDRQLGLCFFEPRCMFTRGIENQPGNNVEKPTVAECGGGIGWLTCANSHGRKEKNPIQRCWGCWSQHRDLYYRCIMWQYVSFVALFDGKPWNQFLISRSSYRSTRFGEPFISLTKNSSKTLLTLPEARTSLPLMSSWCSNFRIFNQKKKTKTPLKGFCFFSRNFVGKPCIWSLQLPWERTRPFRIISGNKPRRLGTMSRSRELVKQVLKIPRRVEVKNRHNLNMYFYSGSDHQRS